LMVSVEIILGIVQLTAGDEWPLQRNHSRTVTVRKWPGGACAKIPIAAMFKIEDRMFILLADYHRPAQSF